jgi:hypothetical protein
LRLSQQDKVLNFFHNIRLLRAEAEAEADAAENKRGKPLAAVTPVVADLCVKFGLNHDTLGLFRNAVCHL